MEPVTDTIRPRIYVACLAAYNSGILHGAWIDADQDAWSIYDGIRAMLKASPMQDAEEWAIHDYEDFEGVRIGESEGINRVAELAAFIAAHGTLGAELINYYGRDLAEAREAITDRYFGSYPTLADYVQDVTGEAIAIPQSLRHYIDWQAMARDAELNGDLLVIEQGFGEVHIFAVG